MYKICAFSTIYSHKWMKKIYDLNIPNVEFEVIIYENLSNLENLFTENYLKFDGIVFSGQIPYLHIRKTLQKEATRIPCMFFDITERDFYYKLAEVQYNDPTFHFNESIIDFIYEENNYLGLKAWLPEDNFPYLLSETIQVFGLTNAYEVVSKRHLQLLKEKKVRYCFTRLTNLYTYFDEVDVEPILVVPTEKSMESTLQKLIKEIELISLKNSQVVCGHLVFSYMANDMQEFEYRQIALYKAILDFNRKSAISLISYRNAIHYEIITNYGDYVNITNNSTNCSLANFLRQELPFKVRIGWGIGKTLQDAQIQAETASTYCNDSVTESYVLTRENQLVGPLEGENFLILSEDTSVMIDDIASKTNISSFQLQKIYTLMTMLKKDELTADEISLHLSITTRTANRLLKKLEECQYATVQTNVVHKGKGRPKNVYKVKFW
ncbi:MAG: hypothetical protein ABS944_11905 [Solibacillus sp.]|uniref:hypothetical protein n=1 Tax=Solibacillus sp. TaxID=1909654 RepID=UPI00331469C8